MDIKSYMRPNIRELIPYTSARHEFSGEASIFLDANENPFETAVNRYPDPLQKEVKQLLADIKNWSPEKIVLGNGSDEIIDLIIRIFCEPGSDKIVIFPPTYGMYKVYADINNVAVEKIQLTSNFQLPEIDIETLNAYKAKLLFLCSPNNPTANSLDRETMLEFCARFNGIVVVDEAYIDFSAQESLITELETYPNLIVMQTFSKAWGLAGIRLGMAYANLDIIQALNNVKPPYNVNKLTQNMALQRLQQYSDYSNNLQQILSQRGLLINELNNIKHVIEKVYPSDSNFLLCRMKMDATDIYHTLIQQGIVVRNRSSTVLCENCLRFTIGTKAENNRLIKALSEL